MVSTLRRFAQTVRHAPGLRSFESFWALLRKPYLRVLTRLASKQGFQASIGGYDMRLHPSFATQNWETVEAQAYRAFVNTLEAGDIVYDVGAHIGTYSLIALFKTGNQGKVVAYEPHGFTRHYLEQHLEWNGGQDRTIIRGVCCGASSGTTDFYCLPDQAEGMNGIVPVEGFQKTTAQVTTIDSEVAEIGLIPSIIKIDVEGAEWDVLKGAEHTINTHHPRIFLSLHPIALKKVNTTPQMILDWLIERGYNCESIAEDHEIHVVCQLA